MNRRDHRRFRNVFSPSTVYLLGTLLGSAALAQSPPNPDYVRVPVFDTYEEFRTALFDAAEIPDTVARDAELDELFATLEAAGQVPFAIGNQAAFLKMRYNAYWKEGDRNSLIHPKGVLPCPEQPPVERSLARQPRPVPHLALAISVSSRR